MHVSNTEMVCFLVIPETPSRDTNSHDDVDDHLGKENEEEGEEIEGAVTPREERENNTEQNRATAQFHLCFTVAPTYNVFKGPAHHIIMTFAQAGNYIESWVHLLKRRRKGVWVVIPYQLEKYWQEIGATQSWEEV